MLGGHRRQECLSCHREAVGIPGILPRVEGRCASKSTIVLNSCFLMDSRNRHSLLESLKTIVGRNEQQFIHSRFVRVLQEAVDRRKTISVVFIDAFEIIVFLIPFSPTSISNRYVSFACRYRSNQRKLSSSVDLIAM